MKWNEYSGGLEKELNFKKIAEKNGFFCEKSKKNQDIYEHWDFNITKDNVNLKVDVKGIKKIDRNDSDPQDTWIWLEIMNVNGEKGWCYGENDGIFFETFKKWFFVKKEVLQKIIENKVKKELVDDPNLAYYKCYRRHGRKDVTTLIKTSDIKPYADLIFEK